MNRREFMRSGSASALGLAVLGQAAACDKTGAPAKRLDGDEPANQPRLAPHPMNAKSPVKEPTVAARVGSRILISTWRHGFAANEAAARQLKHGSALDAVEAGVRVSESDERVSSVGKGGYPNWDGVVQLDACIMDGPSARAGAVAALEEIEHPISVARKVMEDTRHVLLVGAGAQKFALEKGFKKTNLLSEDARAAWTRERARRSSPVPALGHDTIGMCALDAQGHLAVACTTSGMAWKLAGRVGDSPIIGAGAFVDQDVGAAVATGVGEEVMQSGGTFLVVENMRRGMSPAKACRVAIGRIVRKRELRDDTQVAYIALRADGIVGGFCIHKGFSYAHHDGKTNRQVKTAHWQA